MIVRIDLEEYGEDGWQQRVEENLKAGYQVILLNFRTTFHLAECKRIEAKYSVVFKMSSDGNQGSFEKREM